ncbi:MAG: hypothetical protein JXQ80_12965 [Bacteroidales bacterium]|nr:hypothetical protein [Bacteroidales bacterium]
MPLVKETLQTALAADFKDIDLASEDASNKVAEIIANRVDAYIKTATITINTTVTGVCATPAGPGTITGTGSGTGTIA